MNYLIALVALFTLGCTPSRSLFVSMHNPTTNTTLNCSARETRGMATDVLYDAVDACVRQLEARGFVRIDNTPPGKQPISNKPSPPGS